VAYYKLIYTHPKGQRGIKIPLTKGGGYGILNKLSGEEAQKKGRARESGSEELEN